MNRPEPDAHRPSGHDVRLGVPAAAPFLAALVFLGLEAVSASLLLLIGGLLLLQARVIVPTWAVAFDRAVTRFGRGLAAGVGRGLLGLVFALTVLPLSAIASVLRWNPLVLSDRGRWAVSPVQHGVRYRRTFHRETVTGLAGRLRGVAVGVTFALIVAGGIVLAARAIESDRSPSQFTPFGTLADESATPVDEDAVWVRNYGTPISRASFPGEPWAGELILAENAHFSPVPDPDYEWRNADISGRHLNVVDGRRVTTLPRSAPDAIVWMFGGSTTYGIGQRDQGTIASRLVEEAQLAGRSIEVVNLGVIGYVADQETRLFTDLLATQDPPDAAIFLDGCNDHALGYERERFGLLDPAETVVIAATEERQAELTEAARRAGWTEEHLPGRPSALAAAQYGRSVRAARRTAKAFNVPVAHFWQPYLPLLSLDQPMTREVAAALEMSLDGWEMTAEAYDLTRELSAVEPIDISRSLSGRDVPTLFDWCHGNEAAARIQAEAMWPHVQALLP